MKRKRKLKIPSKYYYIALIAVSVLIVGGGLLSDTIKTVKEMDVKSEIIDQTPIGDIVAISEEVGKLSNTQDEAEIDKTKKYPVTFIRAKDGDTYVVKNGFYEVTVRLIGVDTPESVAPSTYSKENTEEGKTVSDIIKDKIATGETLYAEFDTETEDKYGRTLVYLYFENGTMIQDWLLENGYAKTMTVEPNIKYKEHFANIEQRAKDEKKGLWNGFFEE